MLIYFAHLRAYGLLAYAFSLSRLAAHLILAISLSQEAMKQNEGAELVKAPTAACRPSLTGSKELFAEVMFACFLAG